MPAMTTFPAVLLAAAIVVPLAACRPLSEDAPLLPNPAHHKCKVGTKELHSVQARKRRWRAYRSPETTYVPPPGCNCIGGTPRVCDQSSSSVSYCEANADCNPGEFGTFESGGKLYVICMSQEEFDSEVEALARPKPWYAYGASEGVPGTPALSHADLSCGRSLNGRPLSPCYYPEVTTAYMEAAAAASPAAAPAILKVRFNVFDTSSFPREFCDEAKISSDVFTIDFSRPKDGVRETCYCSGSKDQCTGGGAALAGVVHRTTRPSARLAGALSTHLQYPPSIKHTLTRSLSLSTKTMFSE